VFELSSEIEIFLDQQGKDELSSYFKDPLWMQKLAYSADIFDHLNKINLKLQGKETTIVQLNDCLQGFVSKLTNWQRKVSVKNIAMFDKLSSMLDRQNIQLEEDLSNEITDHLQSMEQEFNRYFPELKEEECSLVRNPFADHVNVADLPDEIQDEFLDLKSDSAVRDLFVQKGCSEFWCVMYNSYPQVAMYAFKVLVPFASTYLCESGFSALFHIKTKERNRLNVEDDMRLALTSTQPRISKLAALVQPQSSH
jgi:hypothetical protein